MQVLRKTAFPAIEKISTAGLVDYPQAVSFMEYRAGSIRASGATECLWLLEHPPLYTGGTGAKAGDLLNPKFPVHATGRGGQYTYHGPGQRVAYVMLDLQRRGGDLRRYVSDLEEWLIQTLKDVGVTGERRQGRVGIWVSNNGQEDKIAAIGVRVRKWVTYHGVSINVSPDLGHYGGIVPCGLAGYGVTSLAALGINISMAEFDKALLKNFSDVFETA